MDSIAILLVVLSGLVHSIWNLFAKQSLNKNVFLWYCQWAAILVFLPFVWMEAKTIEAIPLNGFLLVAASMVLHGAYMLLLAKAYAIGDLSQVYPIMRGTSPLLVPIVGVLVLGESLNAYGWIGVALILLGIFLLGDRHGRRSWRINRAMAVAFAVGLLISSYTIVDKLALQHIPAFTLNMASNVGNLVALSFVAIGSGELRRERQANWKTILLGGVLAPGGYLLFLKALEIMPVSQLAPMREIGTVFGTLLGILVLRETQGRLRLMASVAITVGIILLAQS
ncbi:EamA family transporter [Paenibacillaceae bacterium WGS1546]|uniref:EamA family transporter n=1 Tax=Cohnella sp. WGS1546 TaxID=3366810 RepID=UPI00372D3F9E